MATTPNIERQQAALKATTALLRHWAGPPEVQITAPLPPDMLSAVEILDAVPGADLLRLIAANKPVLSALLR